MNRRLAAWLFLLTVLAGVLPVNAEKVVLRIRVANPTARPQTKYIRYALPERVRTNHIINLDGLDLGYDVRNDVYFVHKQVQLEPGPDDADAGALFKVEIEDIWRIDDVVLEEYSKRVKDLETKLATTEVGADAGSLAESVVREVELIRDTQKQYAVQSGANAQDHIRAYETALAFEKRLKDSLGALENLALSQGIDPGGLQGEDKGGLKTRATFKMDGKDYLSAIFRVVVRNPSPTAVRTNDLRRDLPLEIKVEDVLDPAGLEVGTDYDKGITYLYLDDLELQPMQERVFDVAVRDKWNVNGPRIAYLRQQASNVLSRVSQRQRFGSIEQAMRDILVILDGFAKEKGPETLDEEYVAFYRDQTRRLDEIEQKVNRFEAALRPIEKFTRKGFKMPPPSVKTTWTIIYTILGFLAFFSVVFFFRWIGRTKEEAMSGQAAGPGSAAVEPGGQER